MRLVIDIPDGCYEELNNGQFPVQDAYRLVEWIKDGTPLSDGVEILTKEAYSDLCMRAADVPDTNVGDLISRQAVIDTIETDCSWDMFNEWGSHTPTGENIINAIKSVPSVEPKKCGDCISRQAVIDRINKLIEVEKKQGTDDWGYGLERVNAYEAMLHFVKSEYLYPSVEPERKTGHWIEHEWAEELDGEGYLISNFECDKCHAWAEADYAYCPNCGVKMEVNDVPMAESDTGQV